jgi:DNA polymerase (family 10)
MEERLTEIPGVGDAIAVIITTLYRTGTHPSLEKLRKEIRAGVLELLTVPGLRPEKVLHLYKGLGITSPSLRRRQYSRSVYCERSSTAE